MESRLRLEILPQPDDTTCGPTCLHAVYGYFDDQPALAEIIEQTHRLQGGGTLAVFLACHALARGYRATIFTYNLQVFDPTWFGQSGPDLADRLRRQAEFKQSERLQLATRGYLEFLELGGQLRFEPLHPGLIRRYLKRGVPILTGLSATYLYGTAREFGPKSDFDDVRGDPSGHFVVLCGYEPEERRVAVADPLESNPLAPGRYYEIGIDRVIGAILLGVLTHDANLLIIEPARPRARTHADPDRHP